MNIYYTAKDMEELAAKGVTQLEIGPRVFLTDFAYETAEQLEIELVVSGEQETIPLPPARTAAQSTSQSAPSAGRYNKPSGCQHSGFPPSAASSNTNAQSVITQAGIDGSSVNRLVDIMGKIMKRGD